MHAYCAVHSTSFSNRHPAEQHPSCFAHLHSASVPGRLLAKSNKNNSCVKTHYEHSTWRHPNHSIHTLRKRWFNLKKKMKIISTCIYSMKRSTVASSKSIVCKISTIVRRECTCTLHSAVHSCTLHTAQTHFLIRLLFNQCDSIVICCARALVPSRVHFKLHTDSTLSVRYVVACAPAPGQLSNQPSESNSLLDYTL